MRSVSRVSAYPWHESALPATACDHERRTSCWRVRLRRRDLLQDREESSRLHVGACWPRRARHANAVQTQGDWCNSCAPTHPVSPCL